MSDEIKCEIVRDLLPLYVDGLTSDVTKEAVENHINNCEQCKKSLELMMAKENENKYETKEVDYLKKIKKRNSRKMFIGIFSAVILITCIFVWQVFIHGFIANASSIDYKVLINGNNLVLNGSLLNSAEGYSHIKMTKTQGVINLKVYTAPINIFRQSGDFKETFELSEDIKTVYLGDVIIYDNGEIIPKRVAEVYNAKTPYIGDISKALGVTQALGVNRSLGNFTSELQTFTEPYKWQLNFNENTFEDMKQLENEIFAYSCVMLATIDNLGEVSWNCNIAGEYKISTVTAEFASNFAGKDIKECATSANELKKLMVKLGLYR